MSRQTLILISRLLLVVTLTMLGTQALRAQEPAFPSHAPWLNVSRPLTAQDLHGRLILLDFFTPGCINCIHVLPETAKLEHEFAKHLLVIGVNSPKFTASQQSRNLRGFIQRYGIRHPVITDSAMVLWRDYDVDAWPTQVLLDPTGKVVRTYVGEGQYRAIRDDVFLTLATARLAGTLRDTALPLKPMTHTTKGLLQPGKVAVSLHYVAVSDTGHDRVILFNHHGRVLRVVGDGQRGWRDGASKQARFDGPQGLAFRGNTLYVADTGNALIRAIALPSGRVSTLAGNGQHDMGIVGQHPARQVGLNSPWGLQVVGDHLYIAMAGIHQIWQLNLNNKILSPFAGSGNEGIDDGPLMLASFAQSSGLAYHSGELYVSDPEASAVRRIDLKSGEVSTLVGKGLFVFGLRNGPADQALLQHDQGLVWDNNRLYIADTFNNAIRILKLRTHQVTTLATGLAQPGGLAVLDPKTLLVADTNANRIVRVSITNGKISNWPVPNL